MTTNNINPTKTRRNRHQIYSDVMNVLEELIQENGFENLSIQEVCRKANLTYNTFYRNFSTLDNLLDQFINQYDFWLNKSLSKEQLEQLGGENFLLLMFEKLYTDLQENQVMQKLLVWGLSGQSDIPLAYSQLREEKSHAFIEYYSKQGEELFIDMQAFIALMISGVYYMTLFSNNKITTFMGLNFAEEENKQRLIEVVKQLIKIFYNNAQQAKKLLKLQEKMRQDGLSQEQINRYLEVLKG